MYPTITDLIKDLFGLNIPLPIQTFGFFVMVAFIVSGYFLGEELKRKHLLGLLPAIRAKQKVHEKTNQVYGYPISGKFFNVVYDVKKRLPIYTKTEKSKSQYCAGYYLLLLNNIWTKSFCPKNISVNRYQYLGPFRTEAEMSNKLKEVNNAKT
jgi:hypothetical protein